MMRAISTSPDMMLPADPERRLQIEISMLQQIALAQDSRCDGEGAWGRMFMPTASLDHAIQVLISLLDDVG